MMIEIVGKCYKLEKDLVPLLKLKARQAVEIDHLEKFLTKNQEKLAEVITNEFEKAKELVDKFR